ncbi:MAG: hypothetical protein AAGA23_06680 [Pseudomonadota bacterium]
MMRLIPIAAAFCVLSTPVWAGDGGAKSTAKSSTKSTENRYSEWRREGRRLAFIADHDHDGDSRVSSIEFEQSRRDRFDVTDTNGDGVVSEEEYVFEWEDRMDAQLEMDRRSRVQQAEVRFGSMDRSDNEVMEWAEYEGSGDRMFTRRDTNEDLVVDASDPAPSYNYTPKAESEMTAEEKQKRRDRLMSWSRSMLEMPTTHNLEGMMVKYDLNGDERIERAEFDGKRRADFDATDFDHDGVLSLDEYVGEFEDRMDTVIEEFRVASVRQSRRRYQSLDDDGDGAMTFAEYRESGNRIFARYDVSQDGYVNLDDPMPRPFGETTEDPQVAANTE